MTGVLYTRHCDQETSIATITMFSDIAADERTLGMQRIDTIKQLKAEPRHMVYHVEPMLH